MNGPRSEDYAITQQVNLELLNVRVRLPCRVEVQTRDGEVTLSGTVRYAHQKTAAVYVADRIEGVRRVVDRLTVTPLMRS